VSGSGISWAICKSAPRSRQITMPTPHHSIFLTGRMPFLPPNQQHQSTEGTGKNRKRGKIMQECAVPVGWLFCVYPMHSEQISHCNVKMWVCVSSSATPPMWFQQFSLYFTMSWKWHLGTVHFVICACAYDSDMNRQKHNSCMALWLKQCMSHRQLRNRP